MKHLSDKEINAVVGGNQTAEVDEGKEKDSNTYIAYAIAKTTRR
jgi:hypothetical protein